MEIVVEGLEDLDKAAEKILAALDRKLVLLEGDMGAGKTTLIHHLCKAMGVKDHVTSPTFSLVNEYHSPEHGSIYHFDFYRIEDPEEALDMGVDEYFDSGNYCFIEWPGKIRNLIPREHLTIHITTDIGKRIIELKHDEV